jgi:polar amino acid transport system substrate-binding protein
MTNRRRLLALASSAVILVAACGSSATPAPVATAAPTPMPTAAPAATSAAPATPAPATPIPGGLLEKVLKAGVLTVSTDPNYAPQSVKNPDGTFSGFDIDVATEIAKRLGVKIAFMTPDWSLITAGSWSGRWDISVGSMTITADRQKVLDFSPPYYYTPAQMTASVKSGITTMDGLAGQTICAGASTTYLDWLSGKKLDFGSMSPTTTPPAGITVVSRKTDADCPQTWAAGRNDFAGWLSSSTTVDGAIAAKLPVVKVGDPVYFEPLAVAVDKSGPADTDFVAALKTIVDGMHADGTLVQLSQKWFKADLTKGP